MTGSCAMIRAMDPENGTLLPLPAAEKSFGGFSALEVSTDGQRFSILSDRGRFVEGRLLRDRTGALRGVHYDKAVWPGGDLTRRHRLDSEGLADLPDGRIALSTENRGLYMMDPDTFALTRLPSPPDEATLRANRKYEALAAGPDGTLYTMPEKPSRAEGTLAPLWAFDGKGWRAVRQIPLSDHYLLAGADVGPDGALYVLERSWLLTFRSRVRRFDLRHPEQPGTVVWKTDAYPLHNFEGLAVWQAPEGLRMTLVSDNNFLPELGQSLLEVALPAPGA
ncbi:esterase-like activity of phytase family protein [Pseudooceanicola sp. CBS1P-1]|uniref:Esterase-like activity of phytase family protein n=2 Tax=Pseudooceanicola albus TaxID=2692189 RepID=A0A6L7G7W4_9RHOB|nr:esterase-like activity of phytase family protein [Pseudooceanicola endophyticus]MBT9385884.1 esterase-like activity of phytase family protein [Pseudooceanicola endophyticus]MXN20115.1 esterase-like activity of phytase family protein [Pseudooceanicola albus]